MKAFAGSMQTDSRRRALIVVQNLPVPFDRRVWQESKELARNGHTVSVLCPKGFGCHASYEFIDGVHIHRHRLPLEARGWMAYVLEYSWSFVCQMALTWRIFFIRGFDSIQACNPPDSIFLIATIFKLLFGTRFIFDHHDLCPELYEAKFERRGVAYRLLLLLERLTYLTADVSIAPNDSYREIAISRGKMSPDRVFVVRSGPDLNRIRIFPADQRLKMGRKYLIGYVGVIGKQEGLDLLIAAMRDIVQVWHRDDIHCTVVGDGPELESLRRLAAEQEISDYITFTGRIADNELLAVLNTADVCVNPDTVNSLNDKSTMNKILEYMALGKPIVQFDLTEGRFSAATSSLYARANDPADFAAKILELLGAPDRRSDMGRIGRERIENQFAWQYSGPSLLRAYEAAFKGRRPIQPEHLLDQKRETSH